jgi:hypothetical protein
MLMPETHVRRAFCALASVLALALPAGAQPDVIATAQAPSAAPLVMQSIDRLSAGEIIVESREIESIRYVSASVLIDESPQTVWKTLANPFEFEGKICHRMKRLEVLTDEPTLSVLDCTIGVFFPIPDFQYVVESKYTPCSRVEFHRVRGCFKDFRGLWQLEPVDGKTLVTYSMYLDPGMPVPEWLVREGVKHELPSVLDGLRQRVDFLKHNAADAEKRTLMAATSAPPIASIVPAGDSPRRERP